MKAICYPPDYAGCGHFRVLYPAAAAREIEGVDVEVTTRIPAFVRSGTAGVAVVGCKPLDADVVVMQRPLSRGMADVIPHIRAQGVAVVVDVDDDLSCLHAQHVGRPQLAPAMVGEVHWRHMARACQLADLVTVSTPALAHRYGAHGRVMVLPNRVPERLLHLTVERDGRTVGWGGFTQTHPGDLDVTRGGVGLAVRETASRFLVVGDGRGVRQALSLDTEPDVTGPCEFGDYPSLIAQFDVGIAPLADTKFNRAKSCLKGLEYAAVGVPFVASPSPDYLRIAGDGIGLLAKPRARDWARAVRRLLGPEGRELAEQARERVRELHTVEGNAWRWAEAWQHAIEIRKGGAWPATSTRAATSTSCLSPSAL